MGRRRIYFCVSGIFEEESRQYACFLKVK